MTKFVVFLLFISFSHLALAQVIVENSFRTRTERSSEHFDGEVQLAVLPDQWPGENTQLFVTETTFPKGTMTKWHRQKGEQYLISTQGQGQVQFYDTGGRLNTLAISKTGRVYIPSMVCHRFGSSGKGRANSVMHISTGTAQWDNCDQEFAPTEQDKD